MRLSWAAAKKFDMPPARTRHSYLRRIDVGKCLGKAYEEGNVAGLCVDAFQILGHGPGVCSHIRAGDNDVSMAG